MGTPIRPASYEFGPIESCTVCNKLNYRRETVFLCSLVAVLVHVCFGHSVGHSHPHQEIVSADHPTVVYACASNFIRYINSRAANMITDSPMAGVPRMVFEFISSLCGNDTGYGHDFVICLHNSLPFSTYPVDKILMSSLNLSALTNVLHGGCSLLTELRDNLECIISTVMLNKPLSIMCMRDVKQFFYSIITANIKYITRVNTNSFCSTWGNMIECIAPYIAVCSETLTTKWMQYAQQLLVPQCRSVAFAKSEGDLAIEGFSVDVDELLNGEGSAIVSCANQYSTAMVRFMPTSVFNHSVHPSDLIIAFRSVCGEEVQSFMHCMDERRLNMSTGMDAFLFQIISTLNMRMAYNKLCSKLDVLHSNINCLLNSAMEMKQCMCFMNELVEKIHVLASTTLQFPYERIVDTFCGSYVSFVECYVGLLSTCSIDMGMLMNDVYLGVLTTQCEAANATSCSGLIPAMGGSEFLHCGEKVAGYLANVSKNTSEPAGLDYMGMANHMQDLVIGTYAYTCSIGSEVLTCMQKQMMPSQNPFDRLMRMMFNVDKFQSILTQGCHFDLLKELKSRLKFVLTTMMSSPDTSRCIESLSKFTRVLKGHINVQDAQDAEPYCRIWADFSECIESQLACSSPRLVNKWRIFTIDAMTQTCYDVAMEQQKSNQYSCTCMIHPIDDSAVSMCGMNYLIPYKDRDAQRNPILDQVDQVILEEIDQFCDSNLGVGLDMIECLRTIVPASNLLIDRIVSNTFDFKTLETVLNRACSLRPALRNHMACIVDTIQKRDAGDKCILGLVEAYNVSLYSGKSFDDVLHNTCSGWSNFVRCVDPHIEKCAPKISRAWEDLSSKVLSSMCKKRTAALQSKGSIGNKVIVSTVTVLLGLLAYTYL